MIFLCPFSYTLSTSLFYQLWLWIQHGTEYIYKVKKAANETTDPIVELSYLAELSPKDN